MSLSVMLVERKVCLHVANAVLSRLELMYLITDQKMSQMFKKYDFFFRKSPGVNGLKQLIHLCL